ncbi:MAG: NADH-quinone oxidoreductase subunit H, partial [Caldilineaceae bacterium]|nr:NADH-quinone oxidoreductase subunit H [Caldilineaceae bacterium]
TIFFGGWKLPFGILQNVVILGPFVLLAKVLVLLFLFVWVRASIGRPRYDQLMSFTWKFLLPLSLVYMFITALLTIQFK